MEEKEHLVMLGDTFDEVSNHNETTKIDPDYIKKVYLDILHQCLIARSISRSKDASTERGEYEYSRAESWLETADFFTAPASSRFHDCYPCGLLIHTLEVYNASMNLISLPYFKSVNCASAALVALIHDWCKIGTYESYDRNVKNDTTGQWEKVKSYRKIPSKFPFGHGETSMYMGMKFFNLTEEESLAIRWHMGKWYTADDEDNDLSEASHKYPMVYLLQFADQLALREY